MRPVAYLDEVRAKLAGEVREEARREERARIAEWLRDRALAHRARLKARGFFERRAFEAYAVALEAAAMDLERGAR
jgi:hypothetical protein